VSPQVKPPSKMPYVVNGSTHFMHNHAFSALNTLTRNAISFKVMHCLAKRTHCPARWGVAARLCTTSYYR
jgi:hypothetical protein